MNSDFIKEIIINKNVHIKNMHNNYIYPHQNILEIKLKNGIVWKYDLFSMKNMTNVDYFKIKRTIFSSKVTIFKSRDE